MKQQDQVYTYELITLFDCVPREDFRDVFKVLREHIKSHEIADVFKVEKNSIGQKFSRVQLEDGSIIRFNHFYIDVPEKHLGFRRDVAEARSTRILLESSTNEISLEAVDKVLELIAINNLYRGTEWKEILEKFRNHLIKIESVDEKYLNRFYWIQSIKLDPLISGLKKQKYGSTFSCYQFWCAIGYSC